MQDMGGAYAGQIYEVSDVGYVQVPSSTGEDTRVSVDAFPQLFEEIDPEIKEIRLISPRKASISYKAPGLPDKEARMAMSATLLMVILVPWIVTAAIAVALWWLGRMPK